MSKLAGLMSVSQYKSSKAGRALTRRNYFRLFAELHKFMFDALLCHIKGLILG